MGGKGKIQKAKSLRFDFAQKMHCPPLPFVFFNAIYVQNSWHVQFVKALMCYTTLFSSMVIVAVNFWFPYTLLLQVLIFASIFFSLPA